MSELHVPGRPNPSNNPLLVLAERFDAMLPHLAQIAYNTGQHAGAPHVPTVALRLDGSWGVFCLACTQSKGDYIYPCDEQAWDPMPPAALSPSQG